MLANCKKSHKTVCQKIQKNILCACARARLTNGQSLFDFWFIVHSGTCAFERKVQVKHHVHHYSDLPHRRRFGIVNGIEEPLGWSVPGGTWNNKYSHTDTMFISETEVEMKNVKVNGTVCWSVTLNGVTAIWDKCGTAKVDNPDVGSRGTGFDKNVLQFYVPVEHTPGVDPDESIYQLYDDFLSGTKIRSKLGTNFCWQVLSFWNHISLICIISVCI